MTRHERKLSRAMVAELLAAEPGLDTPAPAAPSSHRSARGTRTGSGLNMRAAGNRGHAAENDHYDPEVMVSMLAELATSMS